MNEPPQSPPSAVGNRGAVVIGGGVIGAACAYYLARDGWRVTVLEKNAFGRGCSHGNCGYVSPSHVLPLTVPGMVGMGLRSLFKPSSPFRIKPRWQQVVARSEPHSAAAEVHEGVILSVRIAVASQEIEQCSLDKHIA